MKRITLLAGMLVLAAALVCLSPPAQAAMWVGAEIGPNWMANSDIKGERGGDDLVTLKSVKWDTKVMGGITFGYHFINSGFLAYNWPDWMKYFQFAIDFSFHTFETGPKNEGFVSTSRIKGDVFTVAFLFIGCYGFYPDSVAPFGRVVPYIGVGPALIQSWVSLGTDIFFQGHFNFNRSSTDIGLCTEAGVRFMALKNVSLDLAFRYRWAQPNYDLGKVGGLGNINMALQDAHLFNALVRASYHF